MEAIQVDERVKYRSVLKHWEEGVVVKVNKATYRIVNTNNFKVVSIKKDQVRRIGEE